MNEMLNVKLNVVISVLVLISSVSIKYKFKIEEHKFLTRPCPSL